MASTTDNTISSGKNGSQHTLWAVPLVVAMGLLSLLALSYLASILDPQRNLHDFPLVLVDTDHGEYGKQFTEAVAAALPDEQVWLRQTDAAQADSLMSCGEVYAAIVIADDFTARATALENPISDGGPPPTVEFRTNPRAGTTAVTLATQLVTPALDHASRLLGIGVRANAIANGVQPSDAALTALTNPVQIATTQYRPLPAGTANGISAFYYTLLVVFAGFTGSMMINLGIDAAVANRPDISRWRVLLYKWALAAVMALTMAGLYQLIATALGMPIDHRLTLYLYSALASLAIGMTAIANLTLVSTIATMLRAPVLNTIGMPINMILFIALGLPSSGGIMPIQATPRLYGALAQFEPMHQVFLGIRAILYFDARMTAGLTRALTMCAIGLAIALAIGLLATIGYDHLRKAPSPDQS
ncbi:MULTISPECIES: YhgE/Pip domain-containing protein [unclassified Nocardia]|uniref:YhgE/Pip domain-containing protein n=1 Tax=unclassified Nocardia TaxID=2637762 RepID=UPI001CE3BDDC|nr:MULTISPECIES: DUF3533 domain-containing protein [unclassified Nocardia]